jgi:hypothetical protein
MATMCHQRGVVKTPDNLIGSGPSSSEREGVKRIQITYTIGSQTSDESFTLASATRQCAYQTNVRVYCPLKAVTC